MILEKKDGGRGGGKGERAGSIDRFLIVTLKDRIQAGWTDMTTRHDNFLFPSFLPQF